MLGLSENKKGSWLGHTILVAVILIVSCLLLNALVPTPEDTEEIVNEMVANSVRFASNEEELVIKTLQQKDPEEFFEEEQSPYIEINDGEPFFTEKEKSNTKSFESYSKLDKLGRCGECYANISTDLMPTEPRGEIGQVKPTGWHTVKYNGVIKDNYLYNRCHLIGFQLTGENTNEKNLITGTRYLNIDGMLDIENSVANYVKNTGNHVLYRVTPIFKNDNLICSGLLMEGYSVEDKGEGIRFCYYVFNVQPGITIDYTTGDSSLKEGYSVSEGTVTSVAKTNESSKFQYVLNTKSKKFHKSDCPSVSKMSDKNRAITTKSRQEIIDDGYVPCGNCNP